MLNNNLLQLVGGQKGQEKMVTINLFSWQSKIKENIIKNKKFFVLI